MTIAHNWYPDPYMRNTKMAREAENATWELWSSPFPMMNVTAKNSSFAAVSVNVSNLPPGVGLTLAANIDASDTSKDFRPLIVTDMSYKVLAQTDTMHDVNANLVIGFTVPSDGRVKLRFCAPPAAGEDCTFSRVILTETDAWGLIDGLIPVWSGERTFGYDLMPLRS